MFRDSYKVQVSGRLLLLEKTVGQEPKRVMRGIAVSYTGEPTCEGFALVHVAVSGLLKADHDSKAST